MTAIEELEKLANFYDEDTEGPIYFRALSDRIRDILLRLRTEDRDGKRAALSQSARDLVISWAIPLLERALRHHGSGGQMIPCCDGHVKLGELKLAITDDHDVLSTRHARAIEALRFVEPQYQKVLALMRKVGWKFEDAEDINQKVAFSVYTYLVECCYAARAVLDEEEKG